MPVSYCKALFKPPVKKVDVSGKEGKINGTEGHESDLMMPALEGRRRTNSAKSGTLLSSREKRCWE